MLVLAHELQLVCRHHRWCAAAVRAARTWTSVLAHELQLVCERGSWCVAAAGVDARGVTHEPPCSHMNCSWCASPTVRVRATGALREQGAQAIGVLSQERDEFVVRLRHPVRRV